MSFDLKLQNGNLVLSGTGDLDTVRNSQKLIQDISKLLTTPAGANKMHVWYGSSFGKAIIGTPFDMNFSKDRATEQIISAIETLKTLQISQSKYQSVSASEAISRLLGVNIKTDYREPRLISVMVSVLNRASVRTVIGLDVTI